MGPHDPAHTFLVVVRYYRWFQESNIRLVGVNPAEHPGCRLSQAVQWNREHSFVSYFWKKLLVLINFGIVPHVSLSQFDFLIISQTSWGRWSLHGNHSVKKVLDFVSPLLVARSHSKTQMPKGVARSKERARWRWGWRGVIMIAVVAWHENRFSCPNPEQFNKKSSNSNCIEAVYFGGLRSKRQHGPTYSNIIIDSFMCDWLGKSSHLVFQII